MLDEPDNHLDERGKGWLEQYILDHTGGVAVISHDRYLIDRIANHILELEDGRIVDLSGQLQHLSGDEAGTAGPMNPNSGTCKSGSSRS